MSHYEDLSHEEKIRIAVSAVKCDVPIAPNVAVWLHSEGLYEQVTNPRSNTSESTDATQGGPDTTG